MTFTHISLDITEWLGSYGSRYLCTLFTDDGKNHSFRTLDIDEARTLQWELIAKGASKTESYNPLHPHVYTRNIRYIDF